MDTHETQPDTSSVTPPIHEEPPVSESSSESTPAVKEIHHHHYEKSGYSLSRILGGAILIIIGLGYLADSLGWLEINVNVWQLWPVLIILLGLSILSRKGWVSWVVSSLVGLIILAVVVWALVGDGTVGSRTTELTTVAIPTAESVNAIDVAIDTGAGSLTVNAGGDQAVSGEYKTNYAELSQSSEVKDGRQAIQLTIDGKWHSWRPQNNELDLNLRTDLPYSLAIDSGASDLELDLTEIIAEKVLIDTGASELDLTLGDKTSSEVSVDAGASSVAISLPRTVGARIQVDAGLSSQDFSEFSKESDGVYVSANYQTAEKKVEIQLDLGVSDVDVEWR